MAIKDYYQVLGIGRNASEQEIKQSYRKLARQYHPDINPGDKQAEARFKEINEAYEVLSDSEKRAKYDRFGSDWQRYERAGADGGFYGGVPNSDLSELFETLFGGTPRSGGSRRPGAAGGVGPGGFNVRMDGQDVEQPVEVLLDEAFNGTQRSLQYSNPNGSPRTINVKIPPGVDTGTRIRVAGEGAPGMNGGKRGDLYLIVHVQPHSRYQRKGDDLYVSAPASLYTLLLGGEAKVSTINGRTITLNIPAGTQNGKQFRLVGQGMPRMRQPEARGDLYVTLEVELPTNLTDREWELFEELRRIREG
ncbi:MAG: DnaJ domain-containing protein [Chloroflexaceae bacterium]|nr:DnaJ domain-containing protein [Chloroflexaceae bacterium]